MNRFLTLASIAAALALTSCEDIVDLNVPQGESILVVDGAITDQAGPYVVKLTRTAPYLLDAPPPAVTGASVVLADSEGQQETLRETSPGVYTTSAIRGRVGNRYSLAVTTDGEQYQATTEIRRAQTIDSLQATYHAASGVDKAGYRILYFGQEPAGLGDYYRFQLVQNGALRNKPADLFVSSDELVDGNYLLGLELNRNGPDDVPIVKGDRVRVRVQSLTADYFYFLNEVSTQINNGGIFASSPSNVRTNVRNLNPDSRKKAAGYFAGYPVRTDSLNVE